MNDSSSQSTSDAAKKPRRTFKERIVHNFREVLAMFLYLWLLFALFTYHKAIVLAQHGISFRPYGLALFNAFVLAKIMLIAEEMNLGTRFRRKAPIFPILHKSFLFAVIFLGFNMAEDVAVGLWKGRSIAESIPKIGSGSPLELAIASLIISVALIPFFAFRELSRVMGRGVLGALLMKGSSETTAAQTAPEHPERRTS